MPRKARPKTNESESGGTAGQPDLRQRYKAEEPIKENDAVLEALTLLHSELALIKTEICNKIDEQIRDISASLRGEIAVLKAENEAAVTALKAKMDSQKQTLKELADSAACASGSAVEPGNKLTKKKFQADKKTWLEEKMVLISHAKEAEEKRIQEMKKFAEDRERYAKMQTAMEKLSRQLSDKDADLAKWRRERDSLVAALEVQMTKLAAFNAKKDQQIIELTKKCSLLPQETTDKIERLQHTLSVKESEITALKDQLTVVSNNGQETSLVPKSSRELRKSAGKNEPLHSSNTGKNRSSQASEEQEASVLDSSEISTESGKTSRFPKPELEIQFTPLRPNKVNLRRQGGDSVTVKITRASRKRKSAEMDKDPVNSENKKNNMRISRMNKECEKKSPAAFSRNTHTKQDESQSSLRNKKDGALQKIGDFLQSSPNLLGSKAKKIMEFVQSKSPEPEGGSTLGLKPRKSKRKLYRTEISSPLDIPSNPIIGPDEEDKESDHIIIKRRLRTRTGKKY